jgi:hypothetical protein
MRYPVSSIDAAESKQTKSKLSPNSIATLMNECFASQFSVLGLKLLSIHIHSLPHPVNA